MVNHLLVSFILFSIIATHPSLIFAQTDDNLFTQGQNYLQNGEHDNALESFQLLISKYPHSVHAPYAIYSQALCYLKKADYKKAKINFEQIVKDYTYLKSLIADSLMGLAECYLKTKDYNSALSTYDKISSQYPDKHAEVTLGKAWVYYQQGKIDSAARYFQKIIDSYPSDPKSLEATYILASMYKERKRYKKAVDTFKKIPKDSILANDVYFHLGDIAFKVKNYKKAIEFLRYVKSQESDFDGKVNLQELARYRMTVAYYEQNKFYEARIVCEDFLTRFPDSELAADVRQSLLFACLKQGKIDAALQACKEFEQLYPEEKSALNINFTVAEYLYSMGDYKKAITFYQKQLSIEKQEFKEESLAKIGNSHFYLNDYQQAAEFYKAFLEKYPNSSFSPQVAFRLAYIFSINKNYESALKLYKKIEGKFPETEYIDSVTYNIAWCYLQLKNNAEAIQYYKKFLNNYPSSRLVPFALYEVGNIYLRQRQFEEAIKYYKQIVEEYPELDIAPKATYLLGKCYLSRRNFEDTSKQWRQLISEHEGTDIAKKAHFELIKNFFENKDYENATKEVTSFLNNYPQDPLITEIVHRMLAAYLEQGRFNEGIGAFKQLIEEHRKHINILVELYISLGNLYLSNEEHRNAALTIKSLLSLSNNFSEIAPSANNAYIIGRILMKTNNEYEAMDFYDNIMVTYKDDELIAVSLLGRGEVCLRLRRWLEAEKNFKELLNKYSDSEFAPQAKLGLANSFYFRNIYNEAIKIYKDIIRSYRDESAIEAYYRLGESYFDQGEHKEALPYYQRLIVLYPHRKEWITKSLLKAGRCQESLGAKDMAKSLYEKLIDQYPEAKEVKEAKQRLKFLK